MIRQHMSSSSIPRGAGVFIIGVLLTSGCWIAGFDKNPSHPGVVGRKLPSLRISPTLLETHASNSRPQYETLSRTNAPESKEGHSHEDQKEEEEKRDFNTLPKEEKEEEEGEDSSSLKASGKQRVEDEEQQLQQQEESTRIWEWSRYDDAQSLPLCRTSNDLIQGRWEATVESTALASVCCGWDNEHWKHNTEVCGIDPMPWSNDRLFYQGREKYFAHSGGHGCECPSTRNTDKWKWVPSNCNLLPWDPHRFCELLGNRTMLFIGDSTMGQSASMMMNAVHPGDEGFEYVCMNDPLHIPTYLPTGCQAQIFRGTSDTLIGENLGMLNRGKKWYKLVEMLEPNITILTAGAHISRQADFDRVLDTVRGDIERIRQEYPHMHYIWKTQQPGRCSIGISESIPQTIDQWNAKAYRGNLYNYGEFLSRDAQAKQIFGAINVPIIDLQMMYHRTDAHPGSGTDGNAKDCLHFCMPGPLDLFPILVYHMLLEHPKLID